MTGASVGGRRWDVLWPNGAQDNFQFLKYRLVEPNVVLLDKKYCLT